jgi:hypothetical protein
VIAPELSPVLAPVLGRALPYPQAGTWATGGYWDAQFGVVMSGSDVATVASREGGSVLTCVGTMTRAADPAGGPAVLHDASGTAVLSETNARWAAFGGLHTTAIAFIQVTHAAAPGGTVLAVKNASASQRAVQIVYGSTTTLVAYRYDGTHIPGSGVVLVGGTRETLVYVMHTDGNFYVLSAAGTTVAVADTTASLTVDRIVIGSNAKLRRWGVKRPATTNPLVEAQQLYTALARLS